MPIPTFLLELKERETQRALANLRELPSLKQCEVGNEDSCPVCLLPLHSICEENEVAGIVEEGPSDADGRSTQMIGVVKLPSCGHIFCRRDLAEWIESHHGSCPACRRIFFDFTPIDEAEYESSDGGEYIPEEDEENDWYTDDGELDVVTSSEVDYEMDDEVPEEEENEAEEPWGGYLALPQVPDDAEYDPLGLPPLRTYPLVFADDFLAHSSDLEDEVPGYAYAEISGELSYGSDSASESTSLKTDDTPEANNAGIGPVSDKLEINEGDAQLSKDAEHAKTKSPSVFDHDPSEVTHCSMD